MKGFGSPGSPGSPVGGVESGPAVVSGLAWASAIGANRCVRWLARALVCLVAVSSGLAWSAAVSFTGQLDSENAQDVHFYSFILSDKASLTVRSWGHGGTLGAPGGVNANGAVVPPGGFDPYISLFSGTGATATFVASNDDGVCPPGTTDAGNCFDSSLTITLSAGTYTLAVSSFLNMSFAENRGTGSLGDGFVALGGFGGRTNAFAVDIAAPTLVIPPGAPTNVTIVPGPGSATINFTAPPDNGGNPITSYIVTCTAAGKATVTATGTASPINVTGLLGNVAYVCAVAATNGAGTGSASATVQVTPSFDTKLLVPILQLLLD